MGKFQNKTWFIIERLKDIEAPIVEEIKRVAERKGDYRKFSVRKIHGVKWQANNAC